MELKHLEQIVAICNAGGLSKAARILRISQPSLSKSIARLEAQLGIKLFNRTDGGATPTIYGRYIADRSAGLLSTAAALALEVQQMARGEAGKLRIGSGPATRMRLLPAIIESVNGMFPHLQIEAKFIDLAATIRALRAGDLDVVFCTAEYAQAHEDFVRVKVFEDRNIAAVRAGHPAISNTRLSSSQLLKFPMASSGVIPSFETWVSGCSQDELANVTAFVSDDYGLIKTRALAADYVARGPQFVFEPELRKRQLVELPTTWQSRYECWMLTTRALWQSAVVRSTADLAKKIGRQMVKRPTS